MNTPDQDLFHALGAAHAGYSVAEAIDASSIQALDEAADRGLVEVRHQNGGAVSTTWALRKAITEQQRLYLFVRLTAAGRDYLRSLT
jgi:hypothetical protein